MTEETIQKFDKIKYFLNKIIEISKLGTSKSSPFIIDKATFCLEQLEQIRTAVDPHFRKITKIVPVLKPNKLIMEIFVKAGDYDRLLHLRPSEVQELMVEFGVDRHYDLIGHSISTERYEIKPSEKCTCGCID